LPVALVNEMIHGTSDKARAKRVEEEILWNVGSFERKTYARGRQRLRNESRDSS
jgi:hypothetical protein